MLTTDYCTFIDDLITSLRALPDDLQVGLLAFLDEMGRQTRPSIG